MRFYLMNKASDQRDTLRRREGMESVHAASVGLGKKKEIYAHVSSL